MADQLTHTSPEADAGTEQASSREWELPGRLPNPDPLLESLALLARLNGLTVANENLVAGLPLRDNRLTPELLVRAADRAGLNMKLGRRSLDSLGKTLLPVLLLLRGGRCCVLLDWDSSGRAVVRLPDGSDGEQLLDRMQLEADYLGVAALARPRFQYDRRAPDTQIGRDRHWFWGTVVQSWRLYRDALAASWLINLFVLALPIFMVTVYDRVIPNRAEETLWVLAVGLGLVFMADLVLRVVRAGIVDSASRRIDIHVSSRIMERVLGMRMSNRPVSVGSFAADLRAFESVRDFVASGTITVLVDAPFAALFLVALFWISPWMVIPPLLGAAIMGVLNLLVHGRTEALAQGNQRAGAMRNGTLVESLTALETIKTLVIEGRIQQRWESATTHLAHLAKRSRFLSSLTGATGHVVSQFVSVLSVMVGVYLVLENQATMGAVVASVMLASRTVGPLTRAFGLHTQYQAAKVGLAAIERHMRQPMERDEQHAYLHRDRIKGTIEFKNVSFSYPGQEQEVLRNVSFKIKAGERVGFIGRIGSGKSTIQRLVLGLYQPTEGSILIDGVDQQQLDPAQLRRSIGFVSQDVNLFFGTLKENLTVAAPDADDAQVLAVAQVAGVAEFANRHPKGFDLEIGERGESLSGGQRQAVAIARALMHNPSVLMLDEPSSAMDHQSEDQLKARLKRHMVDRTVLLVTHRTSLLDLVDRLIVLDNGRVVADGNKAQVVEALQSGRVTKAD